jgi:galactokinase
LFGEHLDYLGLPVVSCAISLRLTIDAHSSSDPVIIIRLPDIGRVVTIEYKSPLRYESERDYFRSGLKVLREKGLIFSKGIDCTVHGAIPIAAGTSSSSAMVVSWINLLARMSDTQVVLSPEECATYAHAAEVLEFHEPGGKMDHYATALGGVLFQSFHPSVCIETLTPALGSFVLGDSGKPKDTKGILSSAKNRILSVVRKISSHDPAFSLHTLIPEDLQRYANELDRSEEALFRATIRNYGICREAYPLLKNSRPDEKKFGALLTEHQTILRNSLGISTPQIDRMLDAAMDAGAYGGKINGSGGGGCMFVYAPKNPEIVAEAIEKVGGKAYIVHVDEGTRVEQ